MGKYWLRGSIILLFILVTIQFMLSGYSRDRNQQLFMQSNKIYSVLDFGAKGDGISDDTDAFKEALSAASLSGGTVIVPPGKKGYVITGGVTVPAGVTMMGTMSGFSAGQSETPGPRILARPLPEMYNLRLKLPLFTMEQGSTVRGLNILYDEQAVPTDSEFKSPVSPFYYKSFEDAKKHFFKDHVKPYGPTFLLKGGNTVLEDITASRYYDFLLLSRGGKTMVRSIYLFGYNRAFVYKESQEVNRLQDVHYSLNADPEITAVKTNSPYSWLIGLISSRETNIGVQIGRSDGYEFRNLLFFGIHTAIQLGASEQYPVYDPTTDESYTSDNGPWGSISGLGVDQCVIGLQFVKPTTLANRISNAMIFPSFDDGTKFVGSTSTDSGKPIAKQAAFVVEPTYKTTQFGIPVFMATNTIIASFRDAIRYGEIAAQAKQANGRVFLFDGDIQMEFSNFQISAAYNLDLLVAKGNNAKQAQARIRNFTQDMNALPDIVIDGGNVIKKEW